MTMDKIPEQYRGLPQVDIYLDGTEDLLLSVLLDLKTASDAEISRKLVRELTAPDGAFGCDCNSKSINSFSIRRNGNRLDIFPLINGV